MRSRFFWKLFLGNVLLLLLAVAVSFAVMFRSFVRFHDEEMTAYLRSQAEMVRGQMGGSVVPARIAALQDSIRLSGEPSAYAVRVTLIAPDGAVLADSEHDPRTMANHADRPEFMQALLKGWGESTRRSETLARNLKYVAVRIGTAEEPQGAVRVALPMYTISERTQIMRHLFWTTALVILVGAAALALGLARLWSRPVARITATARSFSEGDLSSSAAVHGTDELAGLARSLNQMRDRLAAQLNMIDHQRLTLESLVAQLHEGVVVAGPDGRIILVNPAAVKMLRAGDPEKEVPQIAPGKHVAECISQPVLRRLLLSGDAGVGSLTDDGAPQESESRKRPNASVEPAGPSGDSSGYREIRLARGSPGPITLLAGASDISLPPQTTRPDGPGWRHFEPLLAGGSSGRLLVLADITEISRALQVKSDFAANASHELRTPLAAILAALETLSGVDPAAAPESVHRLVDIIRRHGRRLETMVRDLLDLSHLESSSARFERTSVRLDLFLAELRERFAGVLDSKGLQWNVALDPPCPEMTASPYLLRLVLDNLVDNAIKFTDDGGRVTVQCCPSEVGFSITIEDDGCGIAPAEHARVFERFYQVERARSGPNRGTGLGLAIVRHAVQAMNGTIRLESDLGRGTRITVHLPRQGG